MMQKTFYQSRTPKPSFARLTSRFMGIFLALILVLAFTLTLSAAYFLPTGKNFEAFGQLLFKNEAQANLQKNIFGSELLLERVLERAEQKFAARAMPLRNTPLSNMLPSDPSLNRTPLNGTPLNGTPFSKAEQSLNDIKVTREGGILNVSFISTSSERAIVLTNLLMDEYLQLTKKLSFISVRKIQTASTLSTHYHWGRGGLFAVLCLLSLVLLAIWQMKMYFFKLFKGDEMKSFELEVPKIASNFSQVLR